FAEKITHDLRHGLRANSWEPAHEEPPLAPPSQGGEKEGLGHPEDPPTAADSTSAIQSRFPPLTKGGLGGVERPGGSDHRQAVPAQTQRTNGSSSTPSSASEGLVAAHHSALDAQRRRTIEGGLKSGAIRAVVTSTSLELGVDIGTADLAVQIGLPGGV